VEFRLALLSEQAATAMVMVAAMAIMIRWRCCSAISTPQGNIHVYTYTIALKIKILVCIKPEHCFIPWPVAEGPVATAASTGPEIRLNATGCSPS